MKIKYDYKPEDFIIKDNEIVGFSNLKSIFKMERNRSEKISC